jgi:hypothetical protein
LTQSKNSINFKLDQSLHETLKEIIEETKFDSSSTPFAEKEMDQIDKERLLRRWRTSEGNFYLNPKKFKFSLRNL